jgi:hypothetical protein
MVDMYMKYVFFFNRFYVYVFYLCTYKYRDICTHIYTLNHRQTDMTCAYAFYLFFSVPFSFLLPVID